MDKEKKVAVCMSTYNGEKYIREQIESIMNQSYRPLYLLVRDDGSSDSTCDIIKEYAKQYDHVLVVDGENKENLKPTRSFFRLVHYAFEDIRRFDYFAFADQDDVWLNDKIEHAIDLLETAKPSRFGKLYYSNKTIVDQSLNVLHEENINYFGDFLEVFGRNLASGCTMVFNRTLAELLLRHIPQCDCYHDAWTYRVGKTLGSTIVFDSQSRILYRQHTSNVVGIIKQKTVKDELTSSWVQHILKSESEHETWDQINEIIRTYQDVLLESENKEIYLNLLRYTKSPAARMKLMWLLRDKGLNKRSFSSRMIWCYRILRNRI